MPAQPTVMFTLFALRSSLSAVGALLCLQSAPSAVFTICSLQLMQSLLFPFCSTFPPCATVLVPSSLHSLQSSPFSVYSLYSPYSTLLTSLYTLFSLLLPPLLHLSTLSALHVCLPCSDLQVLRHVARCTLEVVHWLWFVIIKRIFFKIHFRGN